MLRSLLLASLVQGTQLGPDATAALSSAEGLDALAADLSLTSHGPHPTIDGALHQRLHTLELPGAGRATLAAETLAAVSPLAERLGMAEARARLDDASLAVLDPELYATLSIGQHEREQLGRRLVNDARTLLGQHQLTGDLSWRTKSLYSTLRKMQRKNLAPDEVMDRVALRLVLDDEAACRAMLAALHERFDPVAGEFDDYIRHPKPNGYQSLHTVVRVGEQVAEVQLRTHAMHAHAESGQAAHWRYKLSA